MSTAHQSPDITLQSPSPAIFDVAVSPPALPFTGERIVPGLISEPLFRAHQARYRFAGKFVKGKTVLDVACGTGIGTSYLFKQGAHSCLGLDIDRPAIEYAKAAVKGCRFAQCDATRLSVPDGFFNVVVSFETIEHLNDYRTFLSECSRVLTPGGTLICSTPNRKMSRWARKNEYHVHEFMPAEFHAELSSKFTDIQLFGQDYTNQLVAAARGTLSRSLHAVGLLDFAKSLAGSPPLASQTEFEGTADDCDGEIRSYKPGSLVGPNFIIAVAIKPR